MYIMEGSIDAVIKLKSEELYKLVIVQHTWYIPAQTTLHQHTDTNDSLTCRAIKLMSNGCVTVDINSPVVVCQCMIS